MSQSLFKLLLNPFNQGGGQGLIEFIIFFFPQDRMYVWLGAYSGYWSYKHDR